MRPSVIVALGASAMLSLAHYRGAVAKVRGRAMAGPGGAKLVATIHPSMLLRIPDRDARLAARAAFVADLKLAARTIGK